MSRPRKIAAHPALGETSNRRVEDKAEQSERVPAKQDYQRTKTTTLVKNKIPFELKNSGNQKA